MDKITKYQKRIIEIEKERENLKKKIIDLEQDKKIIYHNLAQEYQKFFISKRKQEFVYYNHFPSTMALVGYLQEFNNNFPLYPYGILNVKELAEIIKHVYQFKTGKVYHILTTGASKESEITKLPIIPQAFFIIGNSHTITEDIIAYHGNYYNYLTKYNEINNIDLMPKSNLVKITLENGNWDEQGIIESLTGDAYDRPTRINYHTNDFLGYADASIKGTKQIFAKNIINNIKDSSQPGIRNTLAFNLHHNDTYLAAILISIIIYKRNNNLIELTQDDYDHIFTVLFKEKAPIKEDTKKDFPRRLEYNPNPKTNR